jgi:hypothetical protein
MLVISALGRLKQEDHEFEASVGYVVKPCLKQEQQKKDFSSLILKLTKCSLQLRCLLIIV